VLIQHYWCST